MKRFVNIFTRFCVVASVAAIILPACTKGTPVAETIQKDSNPYLIPLDKALESLNGFLQSEDFTKSGGQIREIESVSTIRSAALSTKSGEPLINAPDCDEVLYIVNFADNNGFAILSADERIGDDVLAVTESGSIEERNIIEAYSMLKFGLTPLTKYGEQVTTIDTLNCYNEDYDDWYVGDYLGEQGGGIQGEGFVTGLCLDYAQNEINWHGHIGEIGGDDPFTPLYTVVTQATHTYSSPHYSSNLLACMNSWTQMDEPYNDWIFTIWSKHIVGCVSLALGKILTYNEYPQNLSFLWHNIDWTAIKVDVENTGATSVAALLALIFSSTGSVPLHLGTFNLPVLGASFLTLMGYNNVQYQSYNESAIIQSLNNDCPVFISSVPTCDGLTFNIFKSHAWNIDNYRYRTSTYLNYYYLNDVLDHTDTVTQTRTMFHCAWGWGQRCNGYFLSNIFDLAGNDKLLDPEAYHDSTDVENFNHYLKIITYDKPVI